MKTVQTNYYTIDEHPKPDAVYDWIRQNWHDLGQHVVDEHIASLNAFALLTGLSLDYSIGADPSRGEFIRWGNVPDNFTMPTTDENGLTGAYSDWAILTCSTLHQVERKVLDCLHAEVRSIYSDEILKEHCQVNDYHFNETGDIL